MTATAEATSTRTDLPRPFQVDLVAGVILEVANLASTRAFYEPIFRNHDGRWREGRRSLIFECGPQSIEFIQRARPRTFPDGGEHQAYRISRNRLLGLVDELKAAGHAVEWWREDHPAERTPSAYLLDPSGNRVQLMASDDTTLLLDHTAVEVFEFDYVEYIYLKALGGQVDYYHGWKIDDYEQAKSWATGDDPCAPWTRRDNPGWTDFRDQGRANPNLRVARPNTQEFIRCGSGVVGLISATRIRQELPEEVIKGTPRLVLRARGTAADAVAYLSATLPIRFEHEGRSAYLRDPDGNFVELRCEG